jgi:erythronate-4-phosphate dehydrogenase
VRIVADENIPRLLEAFGPLGEVVTRPGRSIGPADVRDADILLVRSVTRVDAALLADSRVRFVGSATIGFDHVDRTWLAHHGITFASAPGCNATAAAEYVVAALLALSVEQGFDPRERSVGIIGRGNVGSRVHERLHALGMRCLVNDPPLEANGAEGEFVSLTTALEADVLTVHVPLTWGGPDRTFHLIDEDFLRRLRPGAILINTSRGAVADCAALERWLADHELTVVLDVWEGEPAISAGLLRAVALGTPHIAGYSLEGRLRGTEMIYRALCAFLGREPGWDPWAGLPAAQPVVLECAADPVNAARAAVLGAYDPRDDDRRLRGMLALPAASQAGEFDRQRKTYPLRREFDAVPVHGAWEPRVAHMLASLGFFVVPGQVRSAFGG